MAEPTNPRKRITTPSEPTSPFTTSTPTDETPMMRSSTKAKDYNSISPSRDQSTMAAANPSHTPNNATNGTSTSSHAPQEGASGRNTDQREAEHAAAHTEWREKGRWQSFWEKYGSVELDNKGSVARDHLALGMLSPIPPFPSYPIPSLPHKNRSTNTHPRTHLPSLAPHIPLLRQHRHSNNAAVPPQHLLILFRPQYHIAASQITASGEAIGCDVYRD
jgi:hypothetical protein